ncbi:hypothetical protein SKAU_G00111500 [Synaphobranchus kaupii]|uniref:Uncharacterized protein n=1 Tax=Synaphobranchus kaupii TaxID=118154 RepID=A0A9Q1G170_SYNKA|nr:hypothetical protein SKAU_G00111500 [Synaphobranchus kaupii]
MTTPFDKTGAESMALSNREAGISLNPPLPFGLEVGVMCDYNPIAPPPPPTGFQLERTSVSAPGENRDGSRWHPGLTLARVPAQTGRHREEPWRQQSVPDPDDGDTREPPRATPPENGGREHRRISRQSRKTRNEGDGETTGSSLQAPHLHIGEGEHSKQQQTTPREEEIPFMERVHGRGLEIALRRRGRQRQHGAATEDYLRIQESMRGMLSTESPGERTSDLRALFST